MKEETNGKYDWITDYPKSWTELGIVIDEEDEGHKERKKLVTFLNKLEGKTFRWKRMQQINEVLLTIKASFSLLGKVNEFIKGNVSPDDLTELWIKDPEFINLLIHSHKQSDKYNGESDEELRVIVAEEMQQLVQKLKELESAKQEEDLFPTRADEEARLSAGAEIHTASLIVANINQKDITTNDPSRMRVIVRAPGAPTSAAIDAPTPPEWDSLALVSDLMRNEQLDVFKRTFNGLSKKDIPIINYALDQIVKRGDGVVRIGFLELLKLTEQQHLGPKEREQFARQVDRALSFIGCLYIDRIAKYKGGKIEESAPLFVYQGVYYENGQKPLSGMYSQPLGFTILDSTYTKDARNDPAILSMVGKLKVLASMPTGKVPLDWAQSIGMAAQYLIRANAKNTGSTRKLSRRELLTRFPPVNTSVEDVLEGANPKRARDYWEEAIKELGLLRVCLIEETKTDWPRKGWKQAWLNETVTVTLLDQGGGATTDKIFKNTKKREQSPRTQVKKKKG
jgi:hypothetical protein